MSVSIDCDFKKRYDKSCALVAIDVIRSTTTAITAKELGRRCFVSASLDDAWSLASKLDNPLLVGEIKGVKPSGFDLNNSPWEVSKRSDIQRPMVLLSTSGTQLIYELEKKYSSVLISCFRNFNATANYLSENFKEVALISPSTRGEFREEDQICCTWIAKKLIERGFTIKDKETSKILDKWNNSSTYDFMDGNSAKYLFRSGQSMDLTFVVQHVNDLNSVFIVNCREIQKSSIL